MNLGLSRRSRGSSIALEKFIKCRDNLSKPSPRLWPDDPKPRTTHLDDLHHPILQKLESLTSVNEFDQVYSQILVSGLLQNSLVSGRVIKKLCTCFGSVSRAVSVFDSVIEPDAFLGNTILRCFVNLKQPFGALRFYYDKIIGRCVLCNHYTFPLMVKVCVGAGLVKDGEKIHALVSKYGFDSDLFVRNSLIHMYLVVCGRVRDAEKVFDGGYMVDLVSWNLMIDGYVKNGRMDVARELFDEMPKRDVFSWNSMLCGYARIQDMEGARYLFETMPAPDAVSWNSMIDGYAAVGDVTMARGFFNRMPRRNVVSWNTILALYVRIKDYTECLRLYEVMVDKGDGLKPNKACFMSALTACGYLGRIEIGRQIHSYVTSNKIKPDVLLSTALLTMYAKCGAMDMAREVFDGMKERSVVSWNSMIIGYGLLGHGEKAIEMLVDLEKHGNVFPNGATLVCVLSACANAGMVLEGWWAYDRLTRIYNVELRLEHHGCLVTLLGRAGLTKHSEELKENSTFVLSSRWTLENPPDIGEILAKRLMRLQPNDIGPYVLLSYIYAVDGKWEEVEKVRKMMDEKKLCIGSNSSCMTSVVDSMLCEIGSESKIMK
ncbi:PREDICTED: pentatricopeptide repeat-containing protein At3g29230-like [Camelina sativa]|uniref:Pentatricopeptide repeat-containing protein At3g29230-like n=1 Tax=Camelina sativa TaxID=90675 RepID=A0ABM0T1C4_CAMSA|nr:PREDICTED: pentatricopeptide repeat-containing protein At3g29230-like [Camelina sativa]